MWITDDLLAAAADHLLGEERRLQAEQAVYGLEKYSEVELHGVLADAFRSRGFGAFREVLYPSAPTLRARKSERQRCDVVLTRSPHLRPADPVETARAAAASLFASLTGADASLASPEDTCWIELKLVSQFTYSRGVPVPNSTYTSELLAGVRGDLRKVRSDPAIRHGAAMLVLFNANPEAAAHDAGVLQRRCREDDPALGDGGARSFRVPDRIGNTVCTLLLFPLR